jgi:hypothetical protein
LADHQQLFVSQGILAGSSSAPGLREGVVGPAVVAEGAGILLSGALNPGLLALPISFQIHHRSIGPNFENIAVTSAEQNEL